MKTVDISEQMRILQMLCAHVQNCFKTPYTQLKFLRDPRDKRFIVQIISKLHDDPCGGVKNLLRGLEYLQDFSLMNYKASDWEVGVSAAWELLKGTEIHVDLEKVKLTFFIPSHTARFEREVKSFLYNLTEAEFKFCTIARLWKIAWKFSEKELTLKNVIVSSDRVFQFEIDDDSEEAEKLMEECLKELEFLAKVPEEV